MSQAQRNQEQPARVRTSRAPLPRPSHVAPAASKPRATLPPPPPLAAYRRLPSPRRSDAPPLSVPAPAHLAILPLWEDANLPLRPAPKPGGKIQWISSTTVSLAVGALVAASLMTVRFGDYAQILPYASAERGLPTVAAAAPVQMFAAEEVLEFELEPEIEQVASAPEPSVIPELKVPSRKIGKATKVTKAKARPIRKAPKQRGKRSRTMLAAPPSAAQPDPQAELKAESVSASPPAAQAQPEPAEAVAPVAAAPEVAAVEAAAPEAIEPVAPALPEKLTRDQVSGGLDKVRAKVLACAKGTYGKILAYVTIRAPGRVSNAVVEGTFAGTKAGSCMEKTVRSAKFPAFSGPDISVRYPYSF